MLIMLVIGVTETGCVVIDVTIRQTRSTAVVVPDKHVQHQHLRLRRRRPRTDGTSWHRTSLPIRPSSPRPPRSVTGIQAPWVVDGRCVPGTTQWTHSVRQRRRAPGAVLAVSLHRPRLSHCRSIYTLPTSCIVEVLRPAVYLADWHRRRAFNLCRTFVEH